MFLIWICMWNDLCGFITCQGIELQNCLNTIPWILDKLKCEIGWIVLWYEIMHNLNWIFGYCCSYVWNVGNWMNWLNSLHVKGWIAKLIWSCINLNSWILDWLYDMLECMKLCVICITICMNWIVDWHPQLYLIYNSLLCYC